MNRFGDRSARAATDGGGGGGGGDDDRTVIRPRPRGPRGDAPAPAASGDDRTVIRPRTQHGAGEDDKTVLRPRPGGRGPAQPARPASAGAAAEPVVGAGLNPLVDAATTLFSLVGQLRGTTSHPDVDGLRDYVVQGINAFDAAARGAGAANEAVVAARYSLCTLIDETVLGTPWGMDSAWSAQSVLSAFHNETFGGEKFFTMLERATRESARNLHLLEFMCVCVALGLEGKYHVMERGRAQLTTVQDDLFRTIRNQRGDFERELSPRWRGVARARRLTRLVPAWVVAAFAGVLLIAIYLGFSYMLNQVSHPTYLWLASISQSAIAAQPAPPIARTLTLREVLAQDIEAGLADVIELNEGSRVVIRGDGLFASGRATVTDDIRPLLARIGDALDQFPGKVLITGHTDSARLSLKLQLRFPSNWHLSQARAETVGALIAAELADPDRVTAEGRGETEPLATNDTREGRARNRRVEITLLTPAGPA
jgi:type VI secretion system protein ImpK